MQYKSTADIETMKTYEYMSDIRIGFSIHYSRLRTYPGNDSQIIIQPKSFRYPSPDVNSGDHDACRDHYGCYL